MKFNEFDFDQQLMDSLEAMRFEEATPIAGYSDNQ